MRRQRRQPQRHFIRRWWRQHRRWHSPRDRPASSPPLLAPPQRRATVLIRMQKRLQRLLHPRASLPPLLPRSCLPASTACSFTYWARAPPVRWCSTRPRWTSARCASATPSRAPSRCSTAAMVSCATASTAAPRRRQTGPASPARCRWSSRRPASQRPSGRRCGPARRSGWTSRRVPSQHVHPRSSRSLSFPASASCTACRCAAGHRPSRP